jgi:hypothetical protein
VPDGYDSDERAPATPATRKDQGMMTSRELSATLGPLLTDAVSFVDTVLSPEREKATRYYNGEPFGNEEEGRSQIVLTEVRDTITGVIPDLAKVFFGPERVVEFMPKKATAVQDARLRTDYVHFNFVERNNGFLETLAVLKDGLTRKIGVYKTWWDDSSDVRAYTLRGVTDEELQLLASDDSTSLISVKDTGPDAHTVHLTRPMPGRIRVKALPPEEFLYNRSARDTTDSFILLAHRTEKTRSELLALGVTEKMIDEHGTTSTSLDTNVEEIARRPDNSVQRDVPAGEANEKYEYTESYMKVDVDGDGIAELRQICTLGSGNYVTNGDGLGEPVDEHPFAIFIPDPEPHTLHGGSWADRTMDLQAMKSAVFRAQADSLSASIFGRMAYIEGQANVNDILNTEIGAPIRMRSPNAVQPFNIPFSGEAATPMLQYLDEVVERRTGRKRGAEGLDMDALQSTTKDGVNAALLGAQAQTEMLARIFAEMTLKPLFRRMYRLLAQNQTAETVKLRDQMVEIDPAAWDDKDLEVSVNVAIGSSRETRLMTIGAAVQKQEFIIQTLGPDNPITTLAMYADTLRRGVELGGFPDVDSFFKAVAPDWKPPQQPPQPSPEMAMVQIEQAKAQHAAQMAEQKMQQDQDKAQQELAQKQAEMQQNYVIEQMKLAQARELEAAQLDAQFGAQVNIAKITADVDLVKEQARIEAENHRTAARIEAENARHRYEADLKHQRETEGMRLEHERAREEAARAAAKPAKA